MFYCLSSFRSSSFAFCFPDFVFDIYVYVYRYTVLSYIVVIFHVFLAILFMLFFATLCYYFVFGFSSSDSCHFIFKDFLFHWLIISRVSFSYYCPLVLDFLYPSPDSFSGFPLLSKPGGFVLQARTDYNGAIWRLGIGHTVVSIGSKLGGLILA